MNVRTVPVSPVLSITIFVRHRADCPRAADEFYKAANAPSTSLVSRWPTIPASSKDSHTVYCRGETARDRGTVSGCRPSQPIESIKLESQIKTIERTVELFLSDKRSQGLDEHVLKKCDRELTRFREFMAKRSKFFPREIALDDLTEFRARWKHLYPSSTTRQGAGAVVL